MKIKLKNISESHSNIENETGNYISIDNKSVENPKGVSPMELLLMGVAGCSSIDIVSILKKQKQIFDDLIIDVEVILDRHDTPTTIRCERICLHVNVHA